MSGSGRTTRHAGQRAAGSTSRRHDQAALPVEQPMTTQPLHTAGCKTRTCVTPPHCIRALGPRRPVSIRVV